MEIVCPVCNKKADFDPCRVNRAKKEGLNIYCSRVCSGLGRRNNKTVEQKRAEKAEYDRKYREQNKDMLKQKKALRHRQTYDPIKAAIHRKTRMPYHVEYCRRPEYKAYKKQYDIQYRAKKDYGEFYEAAIIVSQIDTITDSRETFREKKKYLKQTTTKKRQNERRNTQCNKSEKRTLGNTKPTA